MTSEPASLKSSRLLISACVTVLFIVNFGIAEGQATPALKHRPYICDTSQTTPEACSKLIYYQVSFEFQQTRDIPTATDGFRQVVQLNPNFAAAWFNLGVFAESRSEWSEAQTDFKQYLALSPGGHDAGRASAELRTLQPYLAGTVTAEAIRAGEFNSSISRARILIDKKLYKEALAEAGHAHALDSSRWESYAILTLALKRQGRQTESQHFAQLTLQHAPADQIQGIRAALAAP